MTLPASARPVAFILTPDRARAKLFYQETLGLQLTGNDQYSDIFDLNGTEMKLTGVGDYVPHEHPVLGWEVDDIVATAKTLRDKGVHCSIYEGFGQDDLGIWTSPDGKRRLAWFKDPDGNVLALRQQ
jgi:catechol 2,3-dioxygenase-like lactoylglutathione lyase family enzyme